MNNVTELINEIKQGLTQKSCSIKDEIKVMQTMLNDKEYVVGVYSTSGKVGEYSPAEDARKMITSIIASTTKINKEEAANLAEDHLFTKAESVSMVNISKEFINTYSDTGRKISLGGRENSDIYLVPQEKEETMCKYPTKVGVNDDGTNKVEIREKKVPAHKTMRTKASCPTWVTFNGEE